MRKLLVKQFVGYWRIQSTWPRVIAEHFLLPLTIMVVLLAFQMFFVAGLIAAIGILWVIPVKKHEFKYPRPARKVYYYILMSAAVLHWTDQSPLSLLILGIGLLILLWVAFNGYKVGYFDLWPVKNEELDADQLKDLKDLEQYTDQFKPK